MNLGDRPLWVQVLVVVGAALAWMVFWSYALTRMGCVDPTMFNSPTVEEVGVFYDPNFDATVKGEYPQVWWNYEREKYQLFAPEGWTVDRLPGRHEVFDFISPEGILEGFYFVSGPELGGFFPKAGMVDPNDVLTDLPADVQEWYDMERVRLEVLLLKEKLGINRVDRIRDTVHFMPPSPYFGSAFCCPFGQMDPNQVP